jgi:hypothetical protein
LAATTRTALKAFIEGLGLGLTVFQDEAPQGQALPYVVVVGPIGMTPDVLEDGGTLLAVAQAGATRATGSYQTATELMQVDLFQKWRDEVDHSLKEDYALPEKVFWALHGARLPTAPQVVYACLLRGYVRLFERDNNRVHHAGTIAIKRQGTGA